MAIVIILILIAAIAYFFKDYSDSNPSPTTVTYEYEVHYYERENQVIELKGVGPYYDREDAFDAVEVGDEVLVEWDLDNPYDSDAMGVYTQSMDLIGYIPSGMPSIIETLHRGPFFATIKKKKIEPSERYGQFYRIYINLWMGYPEEEIEELRTKHQKT